LRLGQILSPQFLLHCTPAGRSSRSIGGSFQGMRRRRKAVHCDGRLRILNALPLSA
jgi:hypothetical protein